MPNTVNTTPELAAILGTDVAVGETLKIEACAGAGKSTALRLYAQSHSDQSIMYLTFTDAEARAKRTRLESRTG